MSPSPAAPSTTDRRSASDAVGPRIGILGHVGNENLGDEAIIAAVIQNLLRRWPNAEILGFTIDPSDTEARHGIRSFPIRRGSRRIASPVSVEKDTGSREQPTSAPAPSSSRSKDLLRKIPILFSLARGASQTLEATAGLGKEVGFLRDSRQAVQGLDLLIFAGSHQLNDYVGGPWAFPYTVLKWTRLARAAGAKIVFLSLGAGPIDTWLGRRFIRSALKMASYRSYRDVTGKKAIDSIHLFKQDKVVPDLAFSLALPPASPPAPGRTGRVVGINPLPLYTTYWHESDDQKYASYVGKLAGFADWLVERGCEVRFIPTQLRVDPGVIEDVMARMTVAGSSDGRERVSAPRVETLDDLMTEIAGLDVMIATRYHGIILSLLQQKPVLSIAYHQKSRDVMTWLGLGEYAVEGDTFDVAALTTRFESLHAAYTSVQSSLARQIPEFQRAVQAQYDEIFRIVEGAPGAPRSG